jgi:hypothetical protein
MMKRLRMREQGTGLVQSGHGWRAVTFFGSFSFRRAGKPVERRQFLLRGRSVDILVCREKSASSISCQFHNSSHFFDVNPESFELVDFVRPQVQNFKTSEKPERFDRFRTISDNFGKNSGSWFVSHCDVARRSDFFDAKGPRREDAQRKPVFEFLISVFL